MTSPDSGNKGRGFGSRLFHGRNLGSLLGQWAACFLVASAIYYFETAMPAFNEIVKAMYFVIGVVFVIVTARWFRIRAGDRRAGERRNAERRGSRDQ